MTRAAQHLGTCFMHLTDLRSHSRLTSILGRGPRIGLGRFTCPPGHFTVQRLCTQNSPSARQIRQSDGTPHSSAALSHSLREREREQQAGLQSYLGVFPFKLYMWSVCWWISMSLWAGLCKLRYLNLRINLMERKIEKRTFNTHRLTFPYWSVSKHQRKHLRLVMMWHIPHSVW